MKQIQTRYLYSALLASIFFIFTYLLFKVNIIIAILLTVVVYVGGILLFKEKDIREFDSKSVNNYYFLASKVQNQASQTNDDAIIESVTEITKLLDEILLSLSQRPKKVEQTFDFFDYYLDVTYKILYKYNYINTHEEKDQKFLKNTPKYIKSIVEEFKKLSKNMQESKLLDMQTEIKIFESTSGVDIENIEVGEKNE